MLKHLALVAALGCGCVHIDEAMNREHARLATGAAAARTIDGTLPLSRLPWHAGQWVRLARRDGEVWSVQIVSILGGSGGAYWIEIETLDPSARVNPSRMKMQVRGYDAADPQSVKRLQIGTVITQHGRDRAMVTPPFIGPLASGWVLGLVQLDAAGGVPGTVTVPAGTFTKAVKVRVRVKWGPVESEADNWLHSRVPVWGIVKSVSTDGKYETRLLDYGLSGATSKIAGPVLGDSLPFGAH